MSSRFPRSLTSLIGREAEVASVAALIRETDARLVTLTGPGGIGKTRLAIQIAAELEADVLDRAWFVDLAAVRDHDAVATAIAGTIGARETGGMSPVEAIAAHLGDQRSLVVLDNFEHVLEAAPLVARLLADCPNLTLLVTSRFRLRLNGERIFPVPPLASAVQLFVARAEAASPLFALTETNTPTVAAICQRLDGLPLAIELAAARIPLLSPETMLARLDRRLPLLVQGARDQPERLQTMHAAIAWSHDLLTTDEQVLFRRLSVFVGGFTLEAAEAVGGEGSDENPLPPCRLAASPPPVLDLLASLVDKSLVQRADGADESRFAMLETVREYGLERLTESGEEQAVRLAHAEDAIALGEQADRDAGGGVYRPWFGRLTAEQGNLRAALAWLEAAGEIEKALQLAGALWPLWYVHGPYHEERTLLERVLAAGRTAPLAFRGRATFGAGILALTQGDLDRAETHFAAATAETRSFGYTLGLSGSLMGLAWVALGRGDFAQAAAYQRESLSLARELDKRGEAVGFVVIVLGDLGSGLFALGELDQAEAAFAEAIERRQATNQSWGVAVSFVGRGYVAAVRGEDGRAFALLTEGMTQAVVNGDRRLAALALAGVATLAVGAGRPRLAARLFGAADIPEASGLPIEPAYRAAKDRAVAVCRAAMGDEAFTVAWAEGRALDLDAAIAEAALFQAPEDPASAMPKLSPREVEVLRLIVEGRTDREIGEALFISHRTAMTHVSNILAKLGVETRTAATARALRDNLI